MKHAILFLIFHFSFISFTIHADSANHIESVSGIVATPIKQLPLWRSERNLFGYKPQFHPNVVSFDNENVPYMFDETGIQTLDKAGNWVSLNISASIKKRFPKWDERFKKGPFAEEHVVFDDDGDAYLLINASRSNIHSTLLLHSKNKGKTWDVYPIGFGAGRMEFRDGHNDIPGPPIILLFGGNTRILRMLSPRKKDDGTIDIGQSMIVAEDSLLSPSHSGGGNFCVTKAGLTQIVWASGTPIPGKMLMGTPCYIRTFNHKTRTLSEKTFIGFGGSGRPDPHNIPCLTIDGEGFLHLIIGGHHDQFLYAKSTAPSKITNKWTKLVPIGTPKVPGHGSYTYTGWICDANDTLHCVARWAGDGYYFKLVYLRKKKGAEWENHKYLLSPFRAGYSIWYHKLTLDRKNRLFCNYVYTGGYLSGDDVASFYRKYPDRSFPRGFLKQDPGILLSENGGDTWRLTASTDFSPKPKKLVVMTAKTALFKNKNTPVKLEFKTTYRSGGFMQPLDVRNAIAYVGVDDKLLALDAKNTEKVKPIAEFTAKKGKFTFVKAYKHCLYALNSKLGVMVFDISKPGKLILTDTLAIQSALNIDFTDSNAYVAAGRSGVHILDVSTPSHPKKIKRVATPGSAYCVRYHKNTLYIGLGQTGMGIIDLSNKLNPKTIPFKQGILAEDSVWTLSIRDGKLYASPSMNPARLIFKVYDLANPLLPMLSKRVEHDRWGWGIPAAFAENGCMYVPVIDGVRVLDPSTDYRNIAFWKNPLTDRARRVVIEGSRLYLTLGMGGLKIFDIENPNKIIEKGSYREARIPWTLSSSGNNVFVGDYDGRVYVYDTEKPALPKVASVFESKGKIINLSVNDKRMFILHKNAGVSVYDISDVKAIKKIGLINIKNLRDVAVRGTTMYCAQAKKGLRVFDISNINKPQAIGGYESDREILGISIAGDRLYLALEQNVTGGVKVLNIANPANIRAEGVWFTDTDVYDVSIKNEKAYASLGAAGVAVLNISQPAEIKQVGIIKPHGAVFSCQQIGSTIYIAGGINGFRVVELKTPLE